MKKKEILVVGPTLDATVSQIHLLPICLTVVGWSLRDLEVAFFGFH